MPDRITDGPQTPEDYDDVYGYHEPPDRTDEMRQEQTDLRGQLVYRLEHMIHNIYAKPAFDMPATTFATMTDDKKKKHDKKRAELKKRGWSKARIDQYMKDWSNYDVSTKSSRRRRYNW